MGTLLHVAIAEHHVEAINMLEAHGSNAALCDSDGNSCFHLAVDYGLELTRSQREHPVEALDLRAHRHGENGGHRGANTKRGVRG